MSEVFTSIVKLMSAEVIAKEGKEALKKSNKKLSLPGLNFSIGGKDKKENSKKT